VFACAGGATAIEKATAAAETNGEKERSDIMRDRRRSDVHFTLATIAKTAGSDVAPQE